MDEITAALAYDKTKSDAENLFTVLKDISQNLGLLESTIHSGQDDIATRLEEIEKSLDAINALAQVKF